MGQLLILLAVALVAAALAWGIAVLLLAATPAWNRRNPTARRFRCPRSDR